MAAKWRILLRPIECEPKTVDGAIVAIVRSPWMRGSTYRTFSTVQVPLTGKTSMRSLCIFSVLYVC